MIALLALFVASGLPDAETWLRFLGRLHPIAVHFPIALILSAALLELCARRDDGRPSRTAFACLGLGVLGAGAAVWSGWTFAEGFPPGGAAQRTLQLHRWSGVVAGGVAAVAFVAALVARWRPLAGTAQVYRLALVVGAVSVAWTAHLGGTLVWGPGFHTEVFRSEPAARKDRPAAPPAAGAARPRGPAGAGGGAALAAKSKVEPAAPRPGGAETVAAPAAALVDFERDVWPILASRCVDCHGPRKQKGFLRLDRADDLFDAEREPTLVRAGDPDQSELVRRVALPADDPDVMPARGEPLSAAEIDVLRRWVDEGAPWGTVPAGAGQAQGPADPTPDLGTEPPADPAVPAPSDEGARADLGALEEPEPLVPLEPQRDPFELPAPGPDLEPALERLRAAGARAAVVAENTSGIEVDFGRTEAGDVDLEALDGVASHVVWLDLAHTGVTDAGLAHVGRCSELRRLDLARTAVTGAGLAALAPLQRLEVLNLVGTAVDDAGLEALTALAGLRRVYLWDSAASAEGVAALRTARPDVAVDFGP